MEGTDHLAERFGADNLRVYHGSDYQVRAHKRSCFFCQRCTDIFWDYTHGPYMFVCAIDEDGEMVWEKGLQGTCDGFIEIKVIDNH